MVFFLKLLGWVLIENKNSDLFCIFRHLFDKNGTSTSPASRYFIVLQINIWDQKSKAFMIPYVQKILFLKTNSQIFFKKSFFHKKNLNGTEIDNGQLAQIAAVLGAGGKRSTRLPPEDS